MKNSNDTIGNRTRNLSACSAVPQPTAPPRANGYSNVVNIKTQQWGSNFLRRGSKAVGPMP